MGCCGEKRNTPSYGYTQVMWNNDGPRRVHGGTTGRAYLFSGRGYSVAVDDRDLKNVLLIPGMRTTGGEK